MEWTAVGKICESVSDGCYAVYESEFVLKDSIMQRSVSEWANVCIAKMDERMLFE